MRRIERWYVSIAHLSDERLGFLGYTLVKEDDDFKVYRHYTGEDHIVSKHSEPFLMVDDINDVTAIDSPRIMRVGLDLDGDYGS